MEIDGLREQIDALDIELVKLLEKRQQITTQVGQYKKKVGKPIYDPVREAELIAKRRELAESMGVAPDLIEDLLRRIMRESYQSQHNAYRCMLEGGGKIVVVGGHGALGSRFVDMFERSGFETAVLGSKDWDNAEQIVQDAKLVLVSVPIHHTESVIKQLPKLPQDCILADLTSFKAKPLKAMLEQHDGPVIGLHPMFGPDVPNFVKQVVVACEGRYPEKSLWLVEQIKVWGAVLQEDDSAAHDQSMEIIQAMRHFTTFVYGCFLAEQDPNIEQLLNLSSPIYRLELAMTGRLFAQDANLYADIIFGAEHADNLANKFKAELDAGIEMLTNGDKEQFKVAFNRVAKWFGDSSNRFLTESRGLLKTAQDIRD